MLPIASRGSRATWRSRWTPFPARHVHARGESVTTRSTPVTAARTGRLKDLFASDTDSLPSLGRLIVLHACADYSPMIQREDGTHAKPSITSTFEIHIPCRALHYAGNRTTGPSLKGLTSNDIHGVYIKRVFPVQAVSMGRRTNLMYTHFITKVFANVRLVEDNDGSWV